MERSSTYCRNGWEAPDLGRLSPAGFLFLLYGGLDLLPEAIGGVFHGKKLTGRLRDGLEIGEKGPAKSARLHVRMSCHIHAGPDQFRHVRLKFLA